MKKLMPAFLTCASLALITLAVQPAMANVSQDVAVLMEQVRHEKLIDSNFLQAAPPKQLLPELKKYVGDPSEPVRLYSLKWLVSIARSSRDIASRQGSVEMALTAVEQEPLPALAENVTSEMVSLPPSVFSQKAKDILDRMMSRDVVSSGIVRLAGLANVQTPAVKQRLQKMLAVAAEGNKPKLDDQGQPVLLTQREQSDRDNGKAASWAMAAMGDAAAIQQLVSSLESAPDAVARMGVMQELANTRQPQAVAALVGCLFSEERLPNSMTGTVSGSKLAYRAILLLADVVEGWPSATLRKGTDEALSQARQWITHQDLEKLKIKR